MDPMESESGCKYAEEAEDWGEGGEERRGEICLHTDLTIPE